MGEERRAGLPPPVHLFRERTPSIGEKARSANFCVARSAADLPREGARERRLSRPVYRRTIVPPNNRERA